VRLRVTTSISLLSSKKACGKVMKDHPGTFALQLSVRSWPLSLKTYALGRRIWNPHWRKSLTFSLDSGMSINDTRSSESRTDCLKEHVPWDHFRPILPISYVRQGAQTAHSSGAQSKLPRSTTQLSKQNLSSFMISYKQNHRKLVQNGYYQRRRR
jgi:hypothetical protein